MNNDLLEQLSELVDELGYAAANLSVLHIVDCEGSVNAALKADALFFATEAVRKLQEKMDEIVFQLKREGGGI